MMNTFNRTLHKASDQAAWPGVRANSPVSPGAEKNEAAVALYCAAGDPCFQSIGSWDHWLHGSKVTHCFAHPTCSGQLQAQTLVALDLVPKQALSDTTVLLPVWAARGKSVNGKDLSCKQLTPNGKIASDCREVRQPLCGDWCPYWLPSDK